MASLVEQLEQIDRHLADTVAEGGRLSVDSDAELVDALQVLGRIQRRLDGTLVQATDQVIERDQCERGARLTTRYGCRDAADLLRRTVRVDGHTARRYVAAADIVHRDLDISSGAMLPGAFPELSAALADAELSLTGLLACATPVKQAVRLGLAERATADALLAQFARGLNLDAGDGGDTGDDDDAGDGPANARPDAPSAEPVPTTDELAGLAAHIIARLDPDGAEPDDRVGQRRRHFTIGRLRGGSVPVRGELLPEVAAQLQRLFDSVMNPRVADDHDPAAGASPTGVRFSAPDADRSDFGAGDTECDAGGDAVQRAGSIPEHQAEAPLLESADARTNAQKRHDALASILTVAAASGTMPQLGGAAPTLVVSVRAADYAGRTGRATIEGTGWEVPLGAADHAACAGLVQRVLFDDHGAIIGMGSSGRAFNAHQRRAIVLRDRGCLIPGCDVRAEWCEIHHVEEYSRGGPTHTDNGVPLCWHHHRTLDERNWQIRMRAGVPQIRGPGWWDSYGLWRDPRRGYRAVDDVLDARVTDAAGLR